MLKYWVFGFDKVGGMCEFPLAAGHLPMGLNTVFDWGKHVENIGQSYKGQRVAVIASVGVPLPEYLASEGVIDVLPDPTGGVDHKLVHDSELPEGWEVWEYDMLDAVRTRPQYPGGPEVPIDFEWSRYGYDDVMHILYDWNGYDGKLLSTDVVP